MLFKYINLIHFIIISQTWIFIYLFIITSKDGCYFFSRYDIFQQTYFGDTTNINICFLYNALDRDFTKANTITIQSNRKAMGQLRISSHKLMIERGRWKDIVHKKITCLHCQVFEDEYHVVIVCLKYTVIRKQYIKPYYTEKPCMFKFIQLLKTHNTN